MDPDLRKSMHYDRRLVDSNALKFGVNDFALVFELFLPNFLDLFVPNSNLFNI